MPQKESCKLVNELEMIKNIQHTYQQHILDSRLFELAKESGIIYSKSLEEFWKVYLETNTWMSSYDLQKYMKDKLVSSRKLLHSDSYLGSLQLVHDNLASWKEAKKEWTKNPKKFSGEPKPPKKNKFFAPIIFKKSAIHLNNGFLELSLAKEFRKQPIRIRWSIQKPKYCTIIYDKTKGWFLNCVIEESVFQLELDKTRIMSVDLGEKRIATTFDGKNTIMYNGKYLMSLTRLENKIKGKTQTKLSKKKKGSKNYKNIQRSQRRVSSRLRNKKKDFLHKTSKKIVDNLIIKNIGNIVFGDCSNIHTETNLGKQNQRIQQNPEQQLRKYISYKFESIGGTAEVVSEHYTTQTCPKCNNKYKPHDRRYECKKCGFEFDRDGVGAINIWLNNVSLDKTNVVGFLADPIGVKYQDCSNVFC